MRTRLKGLKVHYIETGVLECSSHGAAAPGFFSRGGEQVDDLQGLSRFQMFELRLQILLDSLKSVLKKGDLF